MSIKHKNKSNLRKNIAYISDMIIIDFTKHVVLHQQVRRPAFSEDNSQQYL